MPEVDGADEVSPRGHGAGAVPVVVGAGQAPAPSSVLTAPGCAGGGAEGGCGHRARGWRRRRASVPICSSCRFSPPFQDSPDSDDESKSLSPLAARCWPDTPGRAGAGGCLPHPAARASALSTGAGQDGSAGEIPVRPSGLATVLAGLAMGGMGSAAVAGSSRGRVRGCANTPPALSLQKCQIWSKEEPRLQGLGRSFITHFITNSSSRW